MQIKRMLKSVIPNSIISSVRSRKEKMNFNSIGRLECSAEKLMNAYELSIEEIFNSGEIEEFWKKSQKEIALFDIPELTGGVNPGDRRAIFYLICKLKPSSVLEIGTHIGASTVHIASALYMSQLQKNEEAKLTTVDIRDVNSDEEKPWLEFGMKYSPIHMINKLNYGSFVNFITADSLKFLEGTERRFDFIFLDGNHSPAAVYQEIPAALKILNQNGVILLHDYFPNLEPLWSNGSVIKGPYMAIERLKDEGANFKVVPLGRLPWKTKLNSNFTSLALLMRQSSK